MKKPVAIACAYLHLSLRPPVFRSAEKDWLKTQAGYLTRLKILSEDLGVPVLCAGDIFDRWNSSVELVNWAACHMPDMIAIPGQHDMPYHQLEYLSKSAFTTLSWARINYAGCLNGWGGGKPVPYVYRPPDGSDSLYVFGYPYGCDVPPCPNGYHGKMTIALIHQYVWTKGYSYPGAPEEARLLTHDKREVLSTYDVVIYGDNHKGFLTQIGHTPVFNCGTFMVRKSDEDGYEPMVGVIWDDRSIEIHKLDVTDDVYLDKRKTAELEYTFDAFMEELSKLETDQLDFTENVRRYCRDNKVPQKVREVLMRAIQGE